VPSRGLRCPGSYAEQWAWFPDDESCLDYPGWLRWPAGPVYPGCGRVARSVATGRLRRCGCRKRVSRTAGTIFQDTRTPLTVWFAAAWYMSADPGGVSALTMQKLLGLGSYQTAWRLVSRVVSDFSVRVRDNGVCLLLRRLCCVPVMSRN